MNLNVSFEFKVIFANLICLGTSYLESIGLYTWYLWIYK